MIIMAPLPVAFFPPPADIAVADRLRVSFSGTGFHRAHETHFYGAVICCKGGQAVGLHLQADIRADDMKEFRRSALQLRDKFGIKT